MTKNKILVLFRRYQETLNDYGNIFSNELIKNGAIFLDYYDIYMKYGKKQTEKYIEDFIDTNNISIMIYVVEPFIYYFSVDFFEKLRKKVFLAMLTADTEHYFDMRDQYYAQAFDLVIGDDVTLIPKLKQIGINAINYYIYFDASRFYKIENIKQDIDVSFVGIIKDKVGRLEYINSLIQNNIKIETFGRDSKNGLLAKWDDYVKVISRSKINVGFSGVAITTRQTRKHNIHKRKKQLKGRIFEVTLSQGFLLVEYVYGIENIFEIGKEIEIFHDKEELLEKIKYYLVHEKERNEIARKGYERAIKEYDVKICVPKLLKTITEISEKKKYKPSEIYLDDEFILNFTTYRVYLILRFIKIRKWKFAFEELKIILKYRKLDWYQIRIILTEEILDMFPRLKKILKYLFKRK